MTKNMIMGLVACFAATMFVGCSANQGLIRGQSPSVLPARFEGTEFDDGTVIEREEFISQERYQEEFEPKGVSFLTYLLHGYWLHPNADDVDIKFNNDKKRDGSDGDDDDDKYKRVEKREKAPTYDHNYRVYRPRGLVYPQQNAPGAVVQYPYYIHKGPDDFFLK